ncbi:interleukin-6 receptor subunit beta [Pagrus major]|uniref:interleukin-6 receptor subunit beta n=1 Tax=Pagrus major TaxID=143350 RepID=UPI003CC89439
MDIMSPKLHLATWTVMNLLCVFSHEVTVLHSDLKRCETDKRVCVTDLRDCGPRRPSSTQRTLNMSCYYQMSPSSMACEWIEESNTESEVSLIFRSKNRISSCQRIFNPVAVLNVTTRTKNYMTGTDIWSQPHTVVLYNAIKPSQPVLTVLGSTADSVDVSWRSSSEGSCRLRHRVNHTHTWTQVPDSFPAHQTQILTYRIKDLLPFTVYRAAVACRLESGIWSQWSNWSPDVTARTLDRVPSRPPEVCYRVEKPDSGASLHLHLMWKDLENRNTGDHILGYQVSYKPVKKQQPQDSFIQNVTGVTALLAVEEGNCSVTVTALNTAGYGPAAHLSIDTQRQNALPSVRKLWVSSSFPAVRGLLVQWENPAAPPSVPPVSHFAVEWCPETLPSSCCWTTVDSFLSSTVIQDVDPDESYLISVFPVYNQQCGSPQSLPASLQQGALIEVVNMKVVGMTRTTVTVAWEWQTKSGPIRVNRYRVMLRKDSERQKNILSFPSLFLWPDQMHNHTFLNLNPDTEYSLLLLADNVSRNIIPVRKDFGGSRGVTVATVIAAVTPLLLLAAIVFIISILSRTVYKSYFFPPISSPRGSTTGQWLMDPNHQKTSVKNVLNIEDFQVTDVLGDQSVIMVCPNSQHSSEEDLHEDTSLLSISHFISKLATLQLDTEYVSDSPVTTEHQLVSLQSYHPDYAVKYRAADIPLLHQAQKANRCFLQKEEESQQDNFSETSHQKKTAVKLCFREFMADTNIYGVYQMSCETECMINSSFLWKRDVETVSGQTDCPYLICETDYKANGCFAKTADNG